MSKQHAKVNVTDMVEVIDESAQVLGDVTLGERASIWMNAVLRGDISPITMKTAIWKCSSG